MANPCGLMSKILLSICIPGVRSRATRGIELYDMLMDQIFGYTKIEVLYFIDNKKRSVGLKRDALLHMSQGKYVTFIDDDDTPADDYITEIMETILEGENEDVITFDIESDINGAIGISKHNLNFDNQPFSTDGFTRKPWQLHAWKGVLARSFHYPDKQWGEDWGWIKQILPYAKTQVNIDKVLYYYKTSDETSESLKALREES